MSNMSYCRFQNTLSDLRGCYEHFLDEDLSKDESEARTHLIEVCRKIVDEAEEIPIRASITAYLGGHNSCGLKVGDKVKIVRKAENYEGGWANGWVESMDDFVGKIGEIRIDCGGAGFRVLSDDVNYSFWSYCFPHFCLEKVGE